MDDKRRVEGEVYTGDYSWSTVDEDRCRGIVSERDGWNSHQCNSKPVEEIEGYGIERYPVVFDLDVARCMFCGLCEEACPEEAIVMSREVELCTYDRASMYYRKEQLLVPEKLLERRLQFLRREYGRSHAPVEEES